LREGSYSRSQFIPATRALSLHKDGRDDIGSNLPDPAEIQAGLGERNWVTRHAMDHELLGELVRFCAEVRVSCDRNGQAML
jgi:hypothetical protein